MSNQSKLDRRQFLGVMSTAAAAAFIPQHMIGGMRIVPPRLGTVTDFYPVV